MHKYDNNLIYYYIKPGKHLEINDIMQVTAFNDQKGLTGKYLNLYEFGDESDADDEVRSWAAQDSGNHHTIADAFVIKSLAQKIIADFYLKFHRPMRPTKVFNSRRKAVQWLVKHLE